MFFCVVGRWCCAVCAPCSVRVLCSVSLFVSAVWLCVCVWAFTRYSFSSRPLKGKGLCTCTRINISIFANTSASVVWAPPPPAASRITPHTIAQSSAPPRSSCCIGIHAIQYWYNDNIACKGKSVCGLDAVVTLVVS